MISAILHSDLEEAIAFRDRIPASILRIRTREQVLERTEAESSVKRKSLRTHMPKPLYDENGKLIGYLREAPGIDFVRNEDGNTVCFYNKVSNRTYDADGNPEGPGDQTLKFLTP